MIPTVLHTSRFLFCFDILRCNLFLRQVKRVEELTVNTTVVYHINTHTDILTPVVFRNTSDHRNTIVKKPFSDSVVPSQATLFGFFNNNGTLLCSADWRVLLITDILSLLKVIYVNGHHLDLFLRQGKYLM